MKLLQILTLLTALSSIAVPLSAQSVCAPWEDLDEATVRDQLRPTIGEFPGSPGGAAEMVVLACQRFRMSRLLALAKSGYLMPLGSSWLTGAANIAWESLADPTPIDEAAEVVEHIARAEPFRLTSEKRLDQLWEARQRPGWSPVARSALDGACILIAERLQDFAARGSDCASSGERSNPGVSTWPLASARFKAFLGDTLGSFEAWRRTVETADSDSDWEELKSIFRWFATPAEMTEFEEAGGDQRRRLLQVMMEDRDIRSGRGRGSYLVTHFTRMVEAREQFGLRIRPGQEGRFLRPPIVSTFRGAFGDTQQMLSDTGWIAAAGQRERVRWQFEIDDRGVIFVRHGHPSRRIPFRAGDEVAELWYYEFTAPRLAFEFAEEAFDGNVGATRLVVGRYGNQWCGIDARRCLYGMRGEISGRTPSPEQIARLRARDREMIDVLEEFDSPWDGDDRPLMVEAGGYRLWEPGTLKPMLLVAYAVPWEENRIAEPLVLSMDLSTWGEGVGTKHLDVTHAAPVNAPDEGLVHAVGFTVAERDSAMTSWQLQVKDGFRTLEAGGRAIPLESVAGVRVSDLVIGTAAAPLRLAVADQSVPLDPGSIIPLDADVELFFQVLVEGEAREVNLRIAVKPLRRLDPTELEQAGLSFGFPTQLSAGLNNIHRFLDVSSLEKGNYTLEVSIVDLSSGASSSSATILELSEAPGGGRE
jgi:hypothetical protein